MGQPRPLFIYFHLFKRTLQFLQKINVKNVHPVYGAGIQTLRPLEHESPPITTRPGLLPKKEYVSNQKLFLKTPLNISIFESKYD